MGVLKTDKIMGFATHIGIAAEALAGGSKMLVSFWRILSHCCWVLKCSMMLRSPEIRERRLGVGSTGGVARKETRVPFFEVNSGGMTGRFL